MSFENTFGEAIVLFNERQYKKAIQKAQETDQYIQTITERAELLTRTANLENFKGHVYIGLNDYKSAKASFEKAISIIPNLPDALAGYSKALVELNDKQTALTAASRAFDLDPGNRIVQFYLSEVLHGVGKTNEAKTILLRYLQQQPKDIDAMETLLKVSGTEEKKKNGVKTELTLVTGVYGSGKSTFAESLGFPVFQIDSYFNYADQKLNYRALKTNIDFVNYFLNDTLEQIVLDGYLLHIDDNLSKLKQVIAPISKITVKFIYTDPEELYASQRSTPERIANREKEKLSKEEDMRWNQKNQHMLRERFVEYLNKGIISNIEYIFREGDNYSIQNADHFMETVGEVI
ncbi:MAG: hypothetical protein JW995_01300, partial [Melioribacteraceae bacterium]|nr:hypothetical protein [Melioribacteraceae bacterium]